MQKLSHKQKAFIIKKAVEGNNKKRSKQFYDRYFYSTVREEFRRITFKSNRSNRRIEVVAPKILSLAENHEEIIEFLSFIRKYSKSPHFLVWIDFTRIEIISPLCALLLTSEIHRWVIIKRKPIRIVDSAKWNPDVKRLLSEMGFFDLVTVSNPFSIENTVSDVSFVKFQSGTINDGKLADVLTNDLNKIAGEMGKGMLLYRGLTEAMQNAIEWAYPKDMGIASDLKRWWMSGSYNLKTKRITIMVYDHGVGIPETLPFSSIKERLMSALAKLGVDFGQCEHSQLIKTAMELGRSASEQAHRGKGLKNIQEFIQDSHKGLLRVISGKGEYTVDQEMIESTKEHTNSLNGTLIAWEVYQE